MENKYRMEWDRLEGSKPRPERARTVIKIDYQEFKEKVGRQDDSFVESIVGALYAGDAFLIKGAFQDKFMFDLRKKFTSTGKGNRLNFTRCWRGRLIFTGSSTQRQEKNTVSEYVNEPAIFIRGTMTP
jgi:hypothetical protein